MRPSEEEEFTIELARSMRSTIVFAPGWQARLRSLGPRRVVVADAQLGAWIDQVAETLGAQTTLTVTLGEANKNLATVEDLYRQFDRAGLTRDSLVVAVGGGVATDLVGFAAATYLRGLAWAAVPTTLLAQVDAAIGGKVGINAAWGKNLIGAFHLPEVVAIDPQFLATLPAREWRAGVGEVMKSALIAGGWLYQILDQVSLDGPSPLWAQIVRKTAAIKVNVVNRDLFESGPRMFLNLGHTIGHALEALLGFGVLSHGEAVGLGTLAVLRLSEELLGLDAAVRRTVVGWMNRWQMPCVLPPLDVTRVWEQLARDKKARADGLTWVLLQEPGLPVLRSNIARELVFRVLEEGRAGQW